MQYEQYVRDLRANDTNNQGDSNGYNVAELEQEVCKISVPNEILTNNFKIYLGGTSSIHPYSMLGTKS